jgi:hypothetical protein
MCVAGALEIILKAVELAWNEFVVGIYLIAPE